MARCKSPGLLPAAAQAGTREELFILVLQERKVGHATSWAIAIVIYHVTYDSSQQRHCPGFVKYKSLALIIFSEPARRLYSGDVAAYSLQQHYRVF